jgi:hypothetical protein
MKDLYKLVSVLIVPLTQRYEVSTNALQLLSKRTSIFQTFILDHGKKLFLDLCELLNQKNRDFLFQVNDTIFDVTREMVRGI